MATDFSKIYFNDDLIKIKIVETVFSAIITELSPRLSQSWGGESYPVNVEIIEYCMKSSIKDDTLCVMLPNLS